MFHLGAALLVAVVLGIASAVGMIGRVFSQPLRNGPWFYNPLIGSQSANPYLRATISKIGLLALNKSEAIYLIADKDSDGNPLRGDASYRIEGQGLSARWWSLTAYGPDYFLIPNECDRYSYSMNDLSWNDDGSYTIYISSAPREGNWIPVDREKSFDLVLRLYNPMASVLKDFVYTPLPTIVREVAGNA